MPRTVLANLENVYINNSGISIEVFWEVKIAPVAGGIGGGAISTVSCVAYCVQNFLGLMMDLETVLNGFAVLIFIVLLVGSFVSKTIVWGIPRSEPQKMTWFGCISIRYRGERYL